MEHVSIPMLVIRRESSFERSPQVARNQTRYVALGCGPIRTKMAGRLVSIEGVQLCGVRLVIVSCEDGLTLSPRIFICSTCKRGTEFERCSRPKDPHAHQVVH